MATKQSKPLEAPATATEATKATTEIVATSAASPTKKKRGRVPQSTAGLDPDDVRTALREVLQAYKMPRVKSDEEMLDRLSAYFETCAERGSHPVIEEMALFCGYTLHGFWDIESGQTKGFTNNTRDIVKKAKFVVQTLDAKLATSGKLNFLAYCFRAKNYYGMQDKVEHVLTPGTPDEYNSADIASRYMIDGGDGDATT